jgi:hypothetical protein
MPKKRPSKPARSPKPKRRSPKGSARRCEPRPEGRGDIPRRARSSPPAAPKRKTSSLLDTRVIFCGDNLQKLADFPDALTEIDAFFRRSGKSIIALTEIDAFFRRSGKSIIALTVQEILDEEIAKKLA